MKAWAKRIVEELDAKLLDAFDELNEYERTIIDVDWTVVAAEERSIFSHDTLVMTCQNTATGRLHDVAIIDPFYPRGVKSLNQLLQQPVVGVNPLVEVRHDDRPLLVCKYARLLLDGQRKVNPHIGTIERPRTELRNCEPCSSNSSLKTERHSFMPAVVYDKDTDASPQTRDRSSLHPGSETVPAEGVTVRWIKSDK